MIVGEPLGTDYVCTQCPEGYTCPDATTITDCGGSTCPPGSSANTPGACEDWIDCADTSLSNCADGQYYDKGGSTCSPCPIDFTCPLRGDTLVAVDPFATFFLFSPTGVNIAFICPAGFDCSDADNIVACGTGELSPEGVETCVACSLQYGCPRTTHAIGG